jgi:hypothetical protein
LLCSRLPRARSAIHPFPNIPGPALKRFALFHPSKHSLPGTPACSARPFPGLPIFQGSAVKPLSPSSRCARFQGARWNSLPAFITGITGPRAKALRPLPPQQAQLAGDPGLLCSPLPRAPNIPGLRDEAALALLPARPIPGAHRQFTHAAIYPFPNILRARGEAALALFQVRPIPGRTLEFTPCFYYRPAR